ncbi:hypothetical protein StoSoilB5_19050 [Arthrobacter sp. StoSoilB5]|nr:hypothetical protein StoSoilB5_19050 [Arthrobacter sp. StoSoilB5]
MILKDLWNEAKQKGWAVGTGELRELDLQSSACGWDAVATRNGEGPTTVLRPVTRTAANPRSISAIHGLNEQPLHVDGSHMPTPPDAIVLFCKTPNQTPTKLWQFVGRRALPSVRPPVGDFEHGIFVVGSGPWAFLAPALEGKRLRYDPTIMEPADARARGVAEYFKSIQVNALSFNWEEPNTFLVIDNRSVLHGRATVTEGDTERVLVRKTFRIEGAQ